MLKYKATKQVFVKKRDKNRREKGSAEYRRNVHEEKALNTKHNMIFPQETLCVSLYKLIECSAHVQSVCYLLLRIPFPKKGNSRHCGIRHSIESLILRLLLDFKMQKDKHISPKRRKNLNEDAGKQNQK